MGCGCGYKRSLRKLACWRSTPADCGGLGLGMVDRAAVFEEAGYSLFGPAALNISAPDEGSIHLRDHMATKPQRLITWMRPAQVREVRRRLAVGEISMSHEGIDGLGHGHRVTHLRGLLEHHGLLPERDAYLARFEHWLQVNFDAIGEAAVRQPVEQFATWHHLRRIRAISATGSSTRGPVHAAKQEITETIKFLDWLLQAHGRVASTCNQHDVDEWLIGGPTTRHSIRTFFVWALRARVNTTILISPRSARSSPHHHPGPTDRLAA